LSSYNHPYRQETAGIIRYSCGILFMLFSFCYLYFLRGEILAEAQFVYSKGVTTYNVLIGAIIITVILQIVQWVVSKLSSLPSRWHALSYVPSMLMLTILTDVNRTTIDHFSFGDWLWVAPVVLVVYVLLVLIVKRWGHGNKDEMYDVKSLAYPNYIILFLLILMAGSVPQSTDVYHFELKAERLILEKDYKGASEVGERSLFTSARLTHLRMYALSKQGLLAERLFEYPQYYGSKGLLDIADTLSTYRLTTQDICFHLGALCGKSIHDANRYYQLMLGDSIWNRYTADYYLCGLLLDNQLSEFRQQLPLYYNLSDSVEGAYDLLPKAYREALLVMGNQRKAEEGKIFYGQDSITTLTDVEMIDRYRDYLGMKARLKDPTERINRTRREFGKTYWWYHDYGHTVKVN